MRWLAILIILAAVVSPADEEDLGASGFDNPRVEQEEKLSLPVEKLDEAWAFFKKTFVDDRKLMDALDPELSSYISEEDFTDTYFDNSKFDLEHRQSGLRLRKRVNLSDQSDPKSGRQLIQLKVNNISKNELERGEIKFDVQDDFPAGETNLLSIVKRKHRQALIDRLQAIGLEAEQMRPVVTLRDFRRRVYFLRRGKSFISVSLDHVRSQKFGVDIEFAEIEPELNEINYTDADAQMKAHMEEVNLRLVKEIQKGLPYAVRDLTPKYNKTLTQLSKQIPDLHERLAQEFPPPSLWAYASVSKFAFPALLLFGALFLIVMRFRRRRAAV